MGLDEFMKLPAMERRQRFAELSIADRVEFVSRADSFELIMGGYPTEERILGAAERSASFIKTTRGEDGQLIH